MLKTFRVAVFRCSGREVTGFVGSLPRPKPTLLLALFALLALVLAWALDPFAAKSAVRVTSGVSPDGRADVYLAHADSLPEGFEATTSEPQLVAPLDSISERVRATVHDTPDGSILELTGSHDSLESFLPPTEPESLTLPAGAARAFESPGASHLAMLAPDGLTIEAVMYARNIGRLPFLAQASSLAVPSHRPSGTVVAEGDLSPYANAATSLSMSYRSPDGATIVVQTFPDEVLDPIVEYLAPAVQRVTIRDSHGYAIDSGNGNLAVATTGTDGQLVIVAATDQNLGMELLLDIAASLTVA